MTDELLHYGPNDELAHYGMLRRSGRYPWGSGENPHQRNKMFLDYVEDLRRQGQSDSEIAKGLGMTTQALKNSKSIAKTQQKEALISQVKRLKEKGLSNVEIGKRIDKNESYVRELLKPATAEKNKILSETADALKGHIDKDSFLDIGRGSELFLGVSDQKLKQTVALLEDEGYKVYYVKIPQANNPSQFTTFKVLGPPDSSFADIKNFPEKIKSPSMYSEDGGRTFLGIFPPVSVDSKRIAVRYAEDGGADMDGVIQLRRGVDDISLGASRYAQVRISVDGTHYLKGMAMYSDDLPKGVDIMFNTNKKNTGNKHDAMKALKDEPDNPFGSIIRQKHYIDANGNKKLSALNIVGTKKEDGEGYSSGEEGGWMGWRRKFSSQMLSKQTPDLAKEQLGLSYSSKKAEYDEIMALTNPTVKKHLLQKFADDAEASAVHLKAASLPRTANHVLLPINSLKDNEVFAPNYKNGEKVVLVRHPHGGIFEIPELTVNNRNREANALIKQAKDAVGINSRVAQRLSGADFDGDTVLVIPNNNKKVKTRPPLEQLKNFDPQSSYPGYPGMKVMSESHKQTQMGIVSNLITDMTLKDATHAEIARAVKHSMVVIDAEKHKLNYKQSEIDNDIAGLKKKYQQRDGGKGGGAATLISRASSEKRVLDRKPRAAADGGPIDPVTGRKVFTETGRHFVDPATGKTVYKTLPSTKMFETDDAYTLSSGTVMEGVYADYANRMKNLANTARKSSISAGAIAYSPTANKTYTPQVSSLKAKLDLAKRGSVLERKAQALAAAQVKARLDANPNRPKDEVKKIRQQAIASARLRVGADRNRIRIEPVEWEAIQAGAISPSFLTQLLARTDLELIRQYATPRDRPPISQATLARARSMFNSGYPQSDIAEMLGISTTALNNALSG